MKSNLLKLYFLLSLTIPIKLFCQANSINDSGRILFMIRQGNHEQGLKLYQSLYAERDEHDYELLHQIGLGILDYGYRQIDPEIQLLTLFGASFALHQEAYYILEGNLKNRHPEIQLIAVTALSQVQEDQADRALLKAMGSPHLIIRYEAAKHLCKKKHPAAVDQTESLLFKSPAAVLPMFPPLFASVGDVKAMRVLKKMINDPSEKIRRSVILSAAKFERDDLLPQIRQQAVRSHHSQQEASAFALGVFKDEQAEEKLTKLSQSQYKTVSLVALWALNQIGRTAAVEQIEASALEGDLYAIALLGMIKDRPNVLLKLVKSDNLQVRINAILALLEQQHPSAVDYVSELLVNDKRDLGFVAVHSPAKTIHYWKAVPSSSQVLADDIEAYQDHMALREAVIAKVRQTSSSAFIALASSLLSARQNDLIPSVVDFLVEMDTPEAIDLLKTHQQKLGAPLVRNYCNLGLYRLGEKGVYADQLMKWVKSESKSELIQFRPYSPWEPGGNTWQLTPQEKSQLLIGAFEAFTQNQDKKGIDVLIEVLATGHQKNKYALAGVLVRATQ